jgi:hypothetical protein
MIHALRTFPSRFVSLADANETLAAERDHALEQHQPDWNSPADKVSRKNNGLEHADCFQSA